MFALCGLTLKWYNFKSLYDITEMQPSNTDNKPTIRWPRLYDLVPKGAQMGGQVFDCQ